MLRLLLCLILISFQTLACTESGEEFLPPNDLKFPISKRTGLSLEQYHEAIDRVLKAYTPVAKQYGATIVMQRSWESETVNAGTYREDQGKSWVINLYGGFARHPYITQDGYMLVVCHEIGHHIGGAPKKYYPDRGLIWASTEGQSDYFATLKCLRKVFRRDNNVEIVNQMDVPENIRKECSLSFTTDGEVALCVRTSMAGLSVARVNADGRSVPLPEFDVVDNNIVDETANNHPVPQCRLDTYYQGSLCTVPSTRIISQTDEVHATCHPKLGFTRGLRPECWFKPKR